MKMRIFPTILIISIILTFSCGLIKESENKLFADGLRLLEKGDSQAAAERFNKIDSLYSKSPYGIYGRGLAFEKDGREFDALNEYLRLSLNNQDFLPGLKRLALLAARTDHPVLALEIASQYGNVEADSTALRELRAQVLTYLGEYELAHLEMDGMSQETLNSPQSHWIFAQLSLHAGDMEAGIRYCSQAVVSDSGRIESLMNVGNFYRALGYFDSAAFYYREALKVSSADYFDKAAVAEALININYLASADELLDELEQVSTKNHIIPYLRARILQAEGRLIEAKEYYPKIVSKSKMSPAILLHMAEIKQAADDIQGAIMALENAGSTADIDSFHIGLANEVIIKKPQLFIELGDWRSADGVLRPILEILPLDFPTVYLVSITDLLADRTDAAEESLARLDILVENNPYRLVKAGDLYKMADSMDAANSRYDLALEKDKINIQAILGKLAISKAREKTENVIKYLEALPNYFLLSPELYPELMALYRESGHFAKAREYVNRLIKAAPEDIARYQLAMELAMSDNHQEDINNIVESCLGANPHNGYADMLAGKYYHRMARNDLAKKHFLSAIAAGIQLEDAHYLMGLSFEEEKQIDSAMVYYQNAANIDQFGGKQFGRMAGILIEKESIDDKTLAQITNYIRLGQRDGQDSYLDFLLGRVQSLQDRYKAAGNNFGKALKDRPDDPKYNFYAGMNYIKLDSLDKARTHLEKALKKGLGGDLKSRAEEALRGI